MDGAKRLHNTRARLGFIDKLLCWKIRGIVALECTKYQMIVLSL